MIKYLILIFVWKTIKHMYYHTAGHFPDMIEQAGAEQCQSQV